VPPRIEVPCRIIYSRIFDRARQHVLSRAILVWRDDAYCRAFRDDEITVEESGLLRDGTRLREPGVAPLPAPSAELPRTLLARAESGGDRLELRLTSLDFAELALPSEPPGRSPILLCEAHAEAAVSGVIRGERFALKAPAILEVNHGSASARPPSSPRVVR
jgi:hypothetical protein